MIQKVKGPEHENRKKKSRKIKENTITKKRKQKGRVE